MRVGIYGGTFAPVHLGHIYAAENFCRACSLDRLLVIPTYIPPHKEKKQTESCEDRLNMLRIAFDGKSFGNTEIIVSDYEIEKGKSDGGKSYTYLTLEHFSENGDKLYLLVGTDMFMSFDLWKNPDIIFRLATVVLMKRDESVSDSDIENKAEQYRIKYGAECIIIDGEPFEISSSTVREKISRNEDVSEYLCKGVNDYINMKPLYKDFKSFSEKIRNDLPLYLKESRIPHVLAVEKEAVRICGLLSLGERDTAAVSCAALLHDITKKFNYEENLSYLKDRGIDYEGDFRLSAKTLHELTGAYFAAEKYPEIVTSDKDNDIFACILYHTTGNPFDTNSLLWKIVFLADFIEETRTYGECVRLREFFYNKVEELGAREAVDVTILEALDSTLCDLISEKKYIHSWTVKARNNAFLYLSDKGLV